MQNDPLTKTTFLKSDIPSDDPVAYDMIVFCHLRWDFVYQRPQHIIHRMSEKLKVLFVEEPISFEKGEENTAELTIINPNLSVLKPRIPSISDLKLVLPMYVANTKVKYGWFYSSAFVTVLNDMDFEMIIYDCMDELTMFKGASDMLRAQEIYLLSEADIVFTGGKSLYESKKNVHDNVHCFPSSVDRTHFGQAANGISVPDDLPKGKPIVGFYGVIDERIDYDLIRETAKNCPDVNFVMVGPTAKIDPVDLPKADNIFYPGMKGYKELPHWLKGFDVAFMPFALNDATKFISPTKTLEFMAANKPIVSTPIYDVVRDYKDCVAIVNNADECCTAIRKFLNRQEEEKQLEQEKFEKILNNTSWDATVSKMQELLKNKSYE
jgi:glycosyltransferase involved in cell wall biosynthesis